VGAVDIPRIAGVLEGPNQLAGFLETAIAATAAWAVATRRTPLLDTALAIGTLAAILTFSRAGIGGVVIVLLSIGLIEGRAAFGALRWSLAGGAAGIAIAAGWAGYAHTPDILRANFAASTCAGGVGSRSQLYEAAWRLFVEHPWLGVGAGNFELDLPLAGVYGVRTHANSWYLQSLAEGGVALLLATLTVVAAILLSLGRRLRSSSPWVIAAFAATLALALHQIVDYLFFYPKVAGPWWIVVGIAAATLARPRVPAMA
jgi:O-antigen ligase